LVYLRLVHVGRSQEKVILIYCPTCNQLELTPKEKGVITDVISGSSKVPCPECRSVYLPLIVPPTFYKDMKNVFLASIWNRADVELRNVDHIVFGGYSFPDADVHIKYLLKRVPTENSFSLN
jgi:hypothetical protein